MRMVAEDCARKIDGAASAPAVEPSPTSAVRRDIRRSPIFFIVILPFDDRQSSPSLCADDLSIRLGDTSAGSSARRDVDTALSFLPKQIVPLGQMRVR